MLYYRYNNTPVLENRCALLYWGRSIITDGYIVANRSDIVLVDRVALIGFVDVAMNPI